MLLSMLVVINVAYWIVYIYLDDAHPSAINILLGILGFCFVGPAMSAIPAAIIALIPIAGSNYWQRLVRHMLGLWLGINGIFVIVMIVSLTDR